MPYCQNGFSSSCILLNVNYHIQESYNQCHTQDENTAKKGLDFLLMKSVFDSNHSAGALEQRSLVCAKRKPASLLTNLLSKFCRMVGTVLHFCMDTI